MGERIMININKVDFSKVMIDEMDFMDKKFPAGTEDERQGMKKKLLARYYESLCYMTLKQLEMALKQCRESFNYFPRINQILKFSPAKQIEESYKMPERIQISQAMQQRIDKISKGSGKFKINKNMMDDMKRMIKMRFSGSDFSEVFARWDRENDVKVEL